MAIMKKLKTKNFVIKVFESIIVIGYIIFEELIWNVFVKPVVHYIKSLVIFDTLQTTFLEMNRHLLLTVFIVILLITEVLGLVSGVCLVNGYIFTSIGVYACKIPVAIFTFWLFDLTKDKLMTFQWLKKSYEYIMGLLEKLVNSSIYIYIKTKKVEIKAKFKSLVLQYFGEEGFISSVKSHYLVFKPYVAKYIKIPSTFKRMT